MIYSAQRAVNQFYYPLLDRWLGLCKRIDTKGGSSYHKELYQRLIYYYNAPGRHYHNLDHIKDCLAKFDEVKHLLSEPVVVELAIWFHDAIYEFWTKPSENEESSASLAIFFIHHLMGLPHEFARRVAYLIESTQYFREGMIPGTTHDGKYMIDIDLCSGLGGDLDDFRRKGELVAKEYDWVTPEIFLERRLEILQMFWTRSPFYLTEYFRDKYEDQTKTNLVEQGIKELERRLLLLKAKPS